MTDKTQQTLAQASSKVGAQAVWASEYSRVDEQLTSSGAVSLAMAAASAAVKTQSKSISSGVPTNGWLIATPEGLAVMGRAFMGKIGSHKGTIPNKLIATVSGKKKGNRWQAEVMFADGSTMVILARTKETGDAFKAWANATNLATEQQAALQQQQAQSFDPNQLALQGR